MLWEPHCLYHVYAVYIVEVVEEETLRRWEKLETASVLAVGQRRGDKRHQTLLKMFNAARERHFLLEVKRKHAGWLTVACNVYGHCVIW